MNLNEEYTYSILDNYNITSGNAGNLMILINYEKMGEDQKTKQMENRKMSKLFVFFIFFENMKKQKMS